MPLDSVFQIVNEETRQPVENPAVRALREGVVVGLANHTLLIAKDGTERPIDDSAAPIRNAAGRSRRGRAGLPRRQRTQAARAAGAGRPRLTPRTSLRPCESHSSSSTRACGSGRPTGLSTGTSTSRRKRRKAASSTTWATASGTSPACGRCWRKSCPNSHPVQRLRGRTRLPDDRPEEHAAQRPPVRVRWTAIRN